MRVRRSGTGYDRVRRVCLVTTARDRSPYPLVFSAFLTLHRVILGDSMQRKMKLACAEKQVY